MVDAPSTSQGELPSPTGRQPELEAEGGSSAAVDAAVGEIDDLALDDEAQAMLAELDSSQAQVSAMLAEHRVQATELGGMRDNLQSELHDLQDETWKLQLFGELEVLKRQLAQLKGLEADMDAAEAVLDAADEADTTFAVAGDAVLVRSGAGPSGAADAQADAAAGGSAGGEGGGGAAGKTAASGGNGDDSEGDNIDDLIDDDGDYDPAEIMRMQAELDKDLATMFTQLQAVKAEAATVSATKAALEAELRSLLAGERPAADQLEGADDDVSGGDDKIPVHP
ncbi:hypothetical protein FOA52_001059 [Chlamydomonas sp. UWO 241]|nr:hypothetical protein FOA52_001059 [Chlamydomonas sp. UWO 241]